jgi:estrogen-related receptor beta like 1
MRTKEKYLNNQYSTICKDYEDIKKKLEDLQKKGSTTNEAVAKLTNELAEVTEKLDELKESFESKDSGINDTSPLVRMKAALQQIKSEIHAFDLRIGVVSHTLLSSRVSANRHRRQGLAQKAKQRRKSSGKKQEAAGDDNSIISDD